MTKGKFVKVRKDAQEIMDRHSFGWANDMKKFLGKKIFVYPLKRSTFRGYEHNDGVVTWLWADEAVESVKRRKYARRTSKAV